MTTSDIFRTSFIRKRKGEKKEREREKKEFTDGNGTQVRMVLKSRPETINMQGGSQCHLNVIEILLN